MKKLPFLFILPLILVSCDNTIKPIDDYLDYETILLDSNETYAYRKVGNGPRDVILIHGNYGSSLYFYPFFARNKKDFTFYAVDLRGFGNSSYNNPFNSIKELSNDILSFMDKLNLDDVDVVGWSLGGAVAMQLAASLKEKAKHLVLIESAKYDGFPIYDTGSKPYESKEAMNSNLTFSYYSLEALKDQDRNYIKYLLSSSMWGINTPAEIDYYVDEAMKERALSDANWALANFNMGDHHNGYSEGSNEIINITAKTLLTAGLSDYTTPVDWIYQTKNQIANSKVVNLISGHSPFTDCPDELYEHVSEFLKE